MNVQQHFRQINGETYLASTDSKLLSLGFIQDSFAHDLMYWAKPLSQEDLLTVISQSRFFGLYKITTPLVDDTPQASSLEQIGIARLVTDQVTIAFLTDVFVSPDYQGKGLGRWLIECVKQYTDSLPELRRVMFMAKNEPHAIRFYEETMGAQLHDQVKSKVVFMGSKAQGLDA